MPIFFAFFRIEDYSVCNTDRRSNKPKILVLLRKEKYQCNSTKFLYFFPGEKCTPTLSFTTVSGGWSTWSEWSDCSSNCGQGFQRRDRKCDNPIPRWGGPMCEENHVERTKCSTPCPGTYVTYYMIKLTLGLIIFFDNDVYKVHMMPCSKIWETVQKIVKSLSRKI